VRPSRSSTNIPLQLFPGEDDVAMMHREVDALRVEFRRVAGRINFRRRRGYIFVSFLVLTLAVAVTIAVLVLSPSEWVLNQQTRFTQMTTLIGLIVVAIPLAGYFARRYDRQRERVRLARTRQREILARLAQLDGLTGNGVRRKRRRRRRSWAWQIRHPEPFSRPPLESLATPELEEAADSLGNSLTEARTMRVVGYVHAAVTGAVTLFFAFVVTLTGPEYLSSLLGGNQWGGSAGVDPLVFWLGITALLVVIGGAGSHRVSVLLRHVRGYQDRLASIERALWDARVLVRERREEV
jgi:hypothetical protein